jgi:hypothetical protein
VGLSVKLGSNPRHGQSITNPVTSTNQRPVIVRDAANRMIRSAMFPRGLSRVRSEEPAPAALSNFAAPSLRNRRGDGKDGAPLGDSSASVFASPYSHAAPTLLSRRGDASGVEHDLEQGPSGARMTYISASRVYGQGASYRSSSLPV